MSSPNLMAIILVAFEVAGRDARNGVFILVGGRKEFIRPFEPCYLDPPELRISLKNAANFRLPIERYEPRKHDPLILKHLGRQAPSPYAPVDRGTIERLKRVTEEQVDRADQRQLLQWATELQLLDPETGSRLTTSTLRELVQVGLGFDAPLPPGRTLAEVVEGKETKPTEQPAVFKQASTSTAPVPPVEPVPVKREPTREEILAMNSRQVLELLKERGLVKPQSTLKSLGEGDPRKGDDVVLRMGRELVEKVD